MAAEAIVFESTYQKETHDKLLKMSVKELKEFCKEARSSWKGSKAKTIADLFTNNRHKIVELMHRREAHAKRNRAIELIESTHLTQEEKEEIKSAIFTVNYYLL